MRFNDLLLPLLFLTVISAKVQGQDIATDNKGKPIFTIPTTKKLTPDIALNNLGLSWTALQLKKTRFFKMVGTDTVFTMDKSTTINLKANITNNEEDILLVSTDMNIAPHFELGVNRAIDKLLNPSSIGSYYTFAGAIFTDFQSFDLYDTVSKSFSSEKYKKWTVGAKIAFNIFEGTRSAWAFNLAYNDAVVTDDLTSYHKRTSENGYSDNNIIVNGESNGYLSPVSPVQNWRFSFSRPWFLESQVNLAIIPYYFVRFGDIKPSHNLGIMFTFLGKKFRDFDIGRIIKSSEDGYEFETAFSVGINFLETNVSKRNYIFLSGTVAIGKTKKEADVKEKSNRIL